MPTLLPPYRELKLCSNKGAYEALPQGQVQLDLGSICATLERGGREVTDARVMLILRGEPEVTISRDGRMIFKTRSLEQARAGFQALVTLLAGG